MELFDVILAIFRSFHTSIASFWFSPRLTYEKDITSMIYSSKFLVHFESLYSLPSDVVKYSLLSGECSLHDIFLYDIFCYDIFCFWCI